MQRINTILGIGIALVIIPLLGFPSTWQDIAVLVLGLWLCGITILIRRSENLPENNKSTKRQQVLKFNSKEIGRGNFSNGEEGDINTTNDYEQTP